jgi:hypothetical protein
MQSILANVTKVLSLGIAGAAIWASAAQAENGQQHHRRNLDRVFIIEMENKSYDNVIGAPDFTDFVGKNLSAPFITDMALMHGNAMNYFGVTHPSLPNYIALFGGDFFGIQDDADTCNSPDHSSNCHPSIDAPNLIDQLEAKHISWEGLAQSLPNDVLAKTGNAQDGTRLYAPKHFPFIYFSSVVNNPDRLAKLKPFDLAAFQAELANPKTMPRFVFIAPDQCNDMHGAGPSCPSSDINFDPAAGDFVETGLLKEETLIKKGDAFARDTVTAIMNSPSFTENSAIFIIWDESDLSNFGCCGEPGGGHIPMVMITKSNKPSASTTPFNHYSLLATIEDGFGLPRIANAKNATPMWDLFPNGGGHDDHEHHFGH